MTKYLEFSSEAEAEAFQAKMDAAEGYPNAATKTERYCLVTKHPTQKRWVCAVDQGQQPKLDALEKGTLKTPTAIAEFFPAEPA